MRAKFKGNCLAQVEVYFAHGNAVNLFVVYELDTWSGDLNTGFTLGDWLLGSVRLYKNPGPGKYGYISYGIGFDTCTKCLLPKGEWGKSVIIFGAGNNSVAHTDNKKKNILVLGEGPTQG